MLARLGVHKRTDGLAYAMRGELAGQPAVYLADDGVFAHVNAEGRDAARSVPIRISRNRVPQPHGSQARCVPPRWPDGRRTAVRAIPSMSHPPDSTSGLTICLAGTRELHRGGNTVPVASRDRGRMLQFAVTGLS